jgi:hypothetical protein
MGVARSEHHVGAADMRMIDHDGHHPLAEPFPTVAGIDDHIPELRERRPIRHYTHEACLGCAGIKSETERHIQASDDDFLRPLRSPAPHFYLPSFAGANGIRLSVIRTNEEEIEAGIRLIGMAAEEILSGQTAKHGKSAVRWI